MEFIKELLISSRVTLKSTQIFIIASTILLTLFITILCVGFLVRYEVDSDVSNVSYVAYWSENLPKEKQRWFEKGIKELQVAQLSRHRQRYARNIVVVVVHGASGPALAAARFANDNKNFVWDSFPRVARLTSTNRSYNVGTALFGGVKTAHVSLDTSVASYDCAAAVNSTHHIKSILYFAQERGIRTGLVTTERLTGPVVGSLYAHTFDNDWECEANVPKNLLSAGCLDIARQLVESEVGKRLNVIMGGGRQALVSNVPHSKWDPLDSEVCNSVERRNLIGDWQNKKLFEKRSFEVLQNADDVRTLNGNAVDYVFGVFANGNLRPMIKEKNAKDLIPNLSEMVEKSLIVLKRKNKSFMLIVESNLKSSNNISSQIEEIAKLNGHVEKLMNRTGADTLSLILFRNSPVNSHSESQETPEDADSLLFANGPQSYLFNGVCQETFLSHAIFYVLRHLIIN